MNPLAVAVLPGCWAGGVLLAALGRRRAAVRFGGCDPGLHATLRAQLVGTALNRVVPAGGGLVLAHLALLRRSRAHGRTSTRGAALFAYAVGGAVTHGLLLGVAVLLLSNGTVRLPAVGVTLPWQWLPGYSTVALIAAATLSAWLVLRRQSHLLDRIMNVATQTLRQLRDHPGDLAALAAFQGGAVLLSAAGLLAAAAAFGVAVSPLNVVVVYLLASNLAGALPVPGGLGALEAALVAGLSLLGVAWGPALATVGLFRFVTYWLPIPLGLCAATADLRRCWVPGRRRLLRDCCGASSAMSGDALAAHGGVVTEVGPTPAPRPTSLIATRPPRPVGSACTTGQPAVHVDRALGANDRHVADVETVLIAQRDTVASPATVFSAGALTVPVMDAP